MSRFPKLILTLVNVFIFVVLLSLIELFFIENKKHNYIQPKSKELGLESIIALTPEQVKKEYGFDIYGAPADVKTPIDNRFTSFTHDMLDLELRQRQHGVAFTSPNFVKKRVELRLRPPHEDMLIYSADYVLNDLYLRVVENQAHKTKADKFIVTMGDSFTFGEGVDNGYDYPSQLAKKIGNDWKVYNHAILGSSTNDYLFKLQTDANYLSDIKEKKGIVIWYFIGDQLERFLCNLYCYETAFDFYIQHKPYYKYENNDFVYKGKFGESKEPIRLLKYYLSRSEAVKFSSLGHITTYPEEQLDIMAKSFSKLFGEIRKKIPAEKFYFVAMHSFKSRTPFIKRMKEQKDITVIDLTEIPQHLDGQNLSFPLDGHPTKEFYWILSEALKSKLDLK